MRERVFFFSEGVIIFSFFARSWFSREQSQRGERVRERGEGGRVNFPYFLLSTRGRRFPFFLLRKNEEKLIEPRAASQHNFFFSPLSKPPPLLPNSFLLLNKMAFALRSAARPALASRRSSASAAAPRRVAVVRAEAENTEAAPAAVAETPAVVEVSCFRSLTFL